MNCVYRSAVLTPVFGKLRFFSKLNKKKKPQRKSQIYFFFLFKRCLRVSKYFIIPGSQPLEMFTSVTGERAVRQGLTSQSTWERMERVQHLPKRHLHLELAGKACCCICQSHVKKWIGKRTEKIIKFLFPPAPPQKCHLLSNSQPTQAARLQGLHRWVLEPPVLPTPWSPTANTADPAGPRFWSPAVLFLS